MLLREAATVQITVAGLGRRRGLDSPWAQYHSAWSLTIVDSSTAL